MILHSLTQENLCKSHPSWYMHVLRVRKPDFHSTKTSSLNFRTFPVANGTKFPVNCTVMEHFSGISIPKRGQPHKVYPNFISFPEISVPFDLLILLLNGSLFVNSTVLLSYVRHYCSRIYFPLKCLKFLVPVVQRLDNAIRRKNHYPADKCQQNKPRYPLDSDLSGG